MAMDYFTPYGSAMAARQYPTRVISGTEILELNGEQQQILIGRTVQYCNELESALNEALTKAEMYYARLVELKDIVPPKTAEELLQEQAAVQQELMITIQKLSDKITRMEENDNANKSTKSSADSSESSQTRPSGSSRKGIK